MMQRRARALALATSPARTTMAPAFITAMVPRLIKSMVPGFTNALVPVLMTAIVPALLTAIALRSALADTTDPHAAEAQQVFRQASTSVVTVLAYDAAGVVSGQGSGVVFEAGRVISNCHVVQDAVRLELIVGAERRNARWTRADRSRDLCVLESDAPAGTPARIRRLAELAVGERVHAIGNPLGFGLAVSSGLITQFAQIGGERVILSSAAQSPGSSGGGLFDAQGRLLGISTSVLTAGQNLNIALPAEWIDELDARGIAPQVAGAPPAPEPSWFDEAIAMQQARSWAQLEQHALAWQQAQPGAARAHLSLAVALLNLGRSDEAERSVREALRHDEHLAAGWHYLGLVLYERGKRAEAEQALARALELLPALSEVHYARAAWLLGDGQAEAALQQAERAVLLDPGEHSHWVMLGRARQQLGRTDEAIAAYRAALGLNERDERSRNELARLLAGRGDDVAAHRALVDRSGGKTDAQTWIAIGNADFDRQRYAPAEASYRKATEASPELSLGWTQLGRALARLQRDDEAAPVLDRALQLDPASVMARLERSNLQARRGQIAAALDDARRATETAPDEAQAWRILAIHSTSAQDWNGAVAAYRKVDALGKITIDDLASLGDALGRLNQRPAALEVFARAEAMDARHEGLLVNLAALHGRGGDLTQAETYLKRALEVAPRNATATSSLGYLQMMRGAPDEAVKTLERAVLLDPALANAWINLGHAALRSRNIGRAITALEKAVQLKPDALDAHLYAAQAFLAVNDGAKALRHAETVLAQQRDFVPALALATLANLIQGRTQDASARYRQLHSRAPQEAQRLRSQAIAVGLAGARELPQ